MTVHRLQHTARIGYIPGNRSQDKTPFLRESKGVRHIFRRYHPTNRTPFPAEKWAGPRPV